MKRDANGANGKKHATQQSLNGAIKTELTWILFLRAIGKPRAIR